MTKHEPNKYAQAKNRKAVNHHVPALIRSDCTDQGSSCHDDSPSAENTGLVFPWLNLFLILLPLLLPILLFTHLITSFSIMNILLLYDEKAAVMPLDYKSKFNVSNAAGLSASAVKATVSTSTNGEIK